MAQTSDHQHAGRPGLLGYLAAPFKTVFNALVTMAESSPRLREIDQLQAMTDAQLAARGLTRDRIIQHVFRDRI